VILLIQAVTMGALVAEFDIFKLRVGAIIEA
jgi:hypothetical protein